MKPAFLFAVTVAITVANVAVLPAARGASPDPRAYAVAGVKLEMTVDEAKAALKAYDATLQMEEQSAPSKDGVTDLYLHAWKPDDRYPRHYSEEVAIAFTRAAPHRAFAVFLDHGLPPERERVFADVDNEVTQTYGPGAKAAGGFHDWVFDADGVLIDGTPSPVTAETSDKFLACWHGLFENTTSLFRVNFGMTAANGLPSGYLPGCSVSVRVIVRTPDVQRPDVVQEVVERLMSDSLALADGRPTYTPDLAPEQLLKRINPHGPDVPNAKNDTDTSGHL